MKVLISKSPEYKPIAIILEIARFRLYRLVQTGSLEETKKRNILKLEFRNKGPDAVNISNILNYEKVRLAVSRS